MPQTLRWRFRLMWRDVASVAQLSIMTNPMNKDQSLLHLLEDLRAEQRERWLKGDHVVAEAYFDLHPKLLAEPESALELVYSEMMLREEAGQKPQLDEYVRRFPQFAGQLPPLF